MPGSTMVVVLISDFYTSGPFGIWVVLVFVGGWMFFLLFFSLR